MKSSAYWRRRFELIEQSQHQKGAECYANIERQYRQAQRELESQIDVWYRRFADNNNVTMAEARRMLTARELEELKWDVRDYIKYGEENAINQQWMKQLENASARYHISRLDALKIQLQHQIEVLCGKQADSIDSAMRDIYESGYYHTAFEIQRGVGVGWNFATLDERKISKVINRPWAPDGKNFSERIWSSRQRLVNELNTELVRNIILGQDPQKAIDAIAKEMNVSKNNAGRLVMTEEAFFSSAAQKDCFTELDVEMFEVFATLDSLTSDICRNMDRKVFPMSQWEVGVTAPPFHVRCRTTTLPAFGDEFDDIGQRAARGEDGKTYYVPGNMTYKEWQQAFVDGDISGLQKVDMRDTANFMDITNEWIKNRGTKGGVIRRLAYTANGTTYEVDGRHVVLRPTDQEMAVANVLCFDYGKKIEFVPQVMYPQGIQTPDYLIDNERFDLKSPVGRGKNLLYSMVYKKSKQSPNFIFDVTNCPLDEVDIEKQISGLYCSSHTRFVDKVVVLKKGKILKVFGRK